MLKSHLQRRAKRSQDVRDSKAAQELAAELVKIGHLEDPVFHITEADHHANVRAPNFSMNPNLTDSNP